MSSAQANLNTPKPVVSVRVLLPWGRWGLRVTAFLYLGLMVALPLATIIKNGVVDGLPAFWEDVTNPTAFAALKLTLTTSIIITIINAVMGTLTAYVLVRFRFPGMGLLNTLIDMPFAIPTLVTGVMLVALYGPQRTVGAWLNAHGIQVIFATPGIVLALLVITYPFVIRAVQPVLMELEKAGDCYEPQLKRLARDLQEQRLLREMQTDAVQQLVEVEGLRDHRESAPLQRRAGHRSECAPGHEDDATREVGARLGKPPRELHTVHHGHHHVEPHVLLSIAEDDGGPAIS